MLNSSVHNCLVLYHPEHVKDYFHFYIRVHKQTGYTGIMVEQFGESKQMNKAYRSQLAKQGVKTYIHANAEG